MVDRDNVTPFRRKEPAAGSQRAAPAPPAERGPTPRERARAVAREQNAGPNSRYIAAQLEQRDQRWMAGPPVPARITWALDICGLDGPEVDEQVGTFEGNPAGDVDDWEAGRAVPTAEQVELLSALTDYPVAWFYQPVEPGPVNDGGMICWRDKRGCQPIVPDVITDAGVLLYEGNPRPPAGDTQIGLFPAGEVPRTRARRRPPDAAPPVPPRAPRRKPAGGPSLEVQALLGEAVAKGKTRWAGRSR